MNHSFPFILSILILGVFPCSSYTQLSQDSPHAWDQSMARLLDLAQEAQAKLIASQPALSVEEILRAIIKANAELDLEGMARFLSRDPNLVIHTINGRIYRGWQDLAPDVELEFRSVERLEIPILNMAVRSQGDTAWFSMDIDYVRYVKKGKEQERMVLPLRETGVLVRRGAEWVIVMWHEYYRNLTARPEIDPNYPPKQPGSNTEAPHHPNLSGVWQILEEDKSYTATLDKDGNGTYTHDGGEIRTTRVDGRIWQGTWSQTGETTGSSREGGFRLVLSQDGSKADGEWWYTRVGDRVIPPHQYGGTYHFIRTL
jgi:hypothetical protein